MGYLSRREIEQLGLAACGEDVSISASCAIHGAEHLSIGSHVRIDDVTVITAREPVRIGSHVHVGAQVLLSGSHGLDIGDFSGISPGVAVFSASDDFTGASLTGPTVPDRYRSVTSGRVRIGRHVVVGARSVVFPGVTIEDGVTVGSLSLVNRSLEGWTIYAGVPARRLRERARDLLTLEAQLLREEGSQGRDT